MATNITSNAEKRVVELVKKCYFGNRLNKALIDQSNNQEIEKNMKAKSLKERVADVLRYKKISVNKASKVLNIPQRTLNRQVNEDGSVGMELLYAILDTYPEISPMWLLLGEGEMVHDAAVVAFNAPY